MWDENTEEQLISMMVERPALFAVAKRVSIFTVLVVATCGYPQKGSQFTSQTSGGDNTATNYASYQGVGPSSAGAPYSVASTGASVPTFVQGDVGYQPVLATSGVGSFGSSVAVGVQAVGGSPVAPASQASAFTPGPTGVAFVASPSLYMPVAGSNAGSQDEPATQWTVPTTTFSEGGSPEIQAISSLLPPPISPPPGPILTSGELSRIEKEAELGNYQQQTEDFGYPAEVTGSGARFGQGFGTVLVPGIGLGGAGLGGFRPVYPGNFDWLFLYGMYPQGTYSTFSQHHETGKDYSQAIHYLKEHVTGGDGSGQQKKFLPGL